MGLVIFYLDRCTSVKAYARYALLAPPVCLYICPPRTNTPDASAQHPPVNNSASSAFAAATLAGFP